MTQPTNRDLASSLADIEAKVRSLRAYIDDLSIRSAYDVAGSEQVVSLDSSVETSITNTETGVGVGTGVILSPVSRLSIGPELAAIGAAWASGVALNTNERCYVPFSITGAKTALSAFVANGTGTIAGNVEVSIYDDDLALLVTTGSIAHSGSGTLQLLALADTAMAAGRYYMSMSVSDGTTTVYRTDTTVDLHRAIGVLFQTAAFTAPATATPAALDLNLPMFGIVFSSAIV